jgi:hypothetical protein
MKTIYLSKSNLSLIDDVTKAVETIENSGNETTQWVKDAHFLEEADAVVAVPYPQEMAKPNTILAGMGQFKEIEKGTVNKPVFVFLNGSFYKVNTFTEFDKEDRNAKSSWGEITISDTTSVPEFMKGENTNE